MRTCLTTPWLGTFLRDLRGLLGAPCDELGIPEESEYLDLYCRNTGRGSIDEREWAFCLAYNLFRIAAIRQGILRRAMDGTASSATAMQEGMLAGDMAKLGWEVVLRLWPR